MIAPLLPGVSSESKIRVGAANNQPIDETSGEGPPLLRVPWAIPGRVVKADREFAKMRVRATFSLLLMPLAMVLWGCGGEQVESGANATARGMERVGGAMESAGNAVGHRLEEAGKGTKLEKVTTATGSALEAGGEKTHQVLGVSAGKAVDKAGEKIKQMEKTAGEKLKDLKEKAGEKLGELKEKAGELKEKTAEELKVLKDKAKDLVNKPDQKPEQKD